MSISERIHTAYDSALRDTGLNHLKPSCPICRACTVCGIQRAPSVPQYSLATQNPNPKRKHSHRTPTKTLETSSSTSQSLELAAKDRELSTALARIETLSSLNLQAYEDLANEKNKFNKLLQRFEEMKHDLSALETQEAASRQKLLELESSLRLSEACRSQTTKQIRHSKLEIQTLQREKNEMKRKTVRGSTMGTPLSTSPSPSLVLSFSSNEREKSQQILETVQRDVQELMALIGQWNQSLESIFMTQPNNEQEWLGLLDGLCRSIVERIEIVTGLL
jgi:hypothetical protein